MSEFENKLREAIKKDLMARKEYDRLIENVTRAKDALALAQEELNKTDSPYMVQGLAERVFHDLIEQVKQEENKEK